MVGNNLHMSIKNNQNKDIGTRIAIARKNLNVSMSRLSGMMHLSRGMCRQWERGVSNPSTAHLIKLAEILHVSFEWLATGDQYQDDRQSGFEQKTVEDNTQTIKINQLLSKMNNKQKECLIVLLNSIVS